jgi:hypothetical protein
LALGAALLVASAGALAQSCTVASGATLSFPPVVALASSGNPSTDSGQSFKISCDASVVTTLRLYSASPRVMTNSAYILPFNLSLNSGASSDDLATGSPGTPVSILRDGQAHAVILYAKILAQNFRSLPGGFYSTSVTLTLEY